MCFINPKQVFSVKRRKSERIKGKWLSRKPGNKPDKPIMLDESDTEEASPLQGAISCGGKCGGLLV